MSRPSLASLTTILLLAAGIAGAQPERPGGGPPPREPGERAPGLAQGRPSLDRPPLDRDAMLERLNDRLAQLEASRDRLAEIIASIEAGTPITEAFDPEDRWLMGRAWRDRRDDAPRFDRDPDDRRPGVGGPPDGPVGDSPRADGPMSETDLARIRALIDEHLPQMAERLRIAEQTDPESTARWVERIAPRFRDILELERDAPELVEVRVAELRTGMEIVTAARDLRRLSREEPGSDAFEAKKNEIRALLARQLDLRRTLEGHRLEKMAADLAEAKARYDSETAQRETIIDGHLARVIERTLADEDRGRGRRGRDDDHD